MFDFHWWNSVAIGDRVYKSGNMCVRKYFTNQTLSCQKYFYENIVYSLIVFRIEKSITTIKLSLPPQFPLSNSTGVLVFI